MLTAAGGRGALGRFKNWTAEQVEVHPVIFTAVLSLLAELVIETAGHLSLWGCLKFMALHPLNFAANYFMVMATISLGHLFKRRTFALTVFAGIWMALGLINGVVLTQRVTPFGLCDLALWPSVGTIVTVYLEVWQIILILLAAVLIVTGLVVVFIRSKKHPPKYRMAAVLISATVLLAVGAYSLTVVGHEEERTDAFANIADAYREYGFVYCFSTGAVDQGVSEPGFYSQASVNWLVGNLDEGEDPEVRPNIIFVQLESFFDVSYLDGVVYKGNPIPNFTAMKRRYSSGFLTVPSVGAGTANTEFEVLSGMSLDYFGMGEYPYKTVLQEKACETVAWDLKHLGYHATAIHNNTATFYGRDQVFAQLGFDNFTSIEYMRDVEYNPIGWAKDKVLTQNILEALDATASPDLVFTITVQGHGKYQRGAEAENGGDTDVTWAADPEDAEAFGYYLEQLSETDDFIGELTEALRKRAEPTVLVLYGDHLPNFELAPEQLKNGDIFQTEYVIWDNMGLPEDDRDLYAYQLSAKVLGDLGISRGILTKYHQQMEETPDYRDGLSLLEYDMLYGEGYCYGGADPYVAKSLQMGVEPLQITGSRYSEPYGLLTVMGNGFTDWTRVYLGEEMQETRLINRTTLTVELEEPPEPGTVLTVRQVTDQGIELSSSVGQILE